jgi:hypothetical protein
MSLRVLKSGDSEGGNDVNLAQTTHPDEAPPVGPLSNFVAKRAKKILNPLCGVAGERVGQRSVAGVSLRQRSKPMFI